MSEEHENDYLEIITIKDDNGNDLKLQVIDEIETQSEFYFIFNQKQIDVNRIVNVHEDNKMITEILPGLAARLP